MPGPCLVPAWTSPPQRSRGCVARTAMHRFLYVCTGFVDFLPLTLWAVGWCKTAGWEWERPPCTCKRYHCILQVQVFRASSSLPPFHGVFNRACETLLHNTTMDQLLIAWQAVDSRVQVLTFIRAPKTLPQDSRHAMIHAMP